MDRDTVIALARQAGWPVQDSDNDAEWLDAAERFAALVAAHEREACAQVCEEKFGVERIALECAAAIRSRT